MPDGSASGQEPQLRKWIVFGAWILGVIVLASVVFVAPLGLKAYDGAHQITVTCEVSSATAGTAASRSVRGTGASVNEVVIESPDCGRLSWRWGVTDENKRRLAARFTAGQRYRFAVGEASYRWRDALRTLRQRQLDRPAGRLCFGVG